MEEQLRLSEMLGVSRVDNHDIYLGVPIHIGRSRQEVFGYIRDRAQRKASSWKHRHLSAGGKEVMIKYILQTTPVYVMSCFELPKSICDDIHSIIAKFWWGSSDGKKKVHWVLWDKLCDHKEDGGLGFRHMHDFNLSMLAKQAWRIMQESDSLLSQVLKAKYFSESDLLTAEVKGGASYSWRSIMAGRKILMNGLRFQVGDGANISVWKDPWIPLPFHFKPFSFPACGTEDLKVNDLMSQGKWDIELLELLFSDTETRYIASIPLSTRGRPDRLTWHYTRDGEFSVRSCYCAWRASIKGDSRASSSTGSSAPISKGWRRLWLLAIPPKIRVFGWRLLHRALPTRARLQARHLKIDSFLCPLKIDSFLCPLCDEVIETLNHVLFDCVVVRSFWRSHALAAAVERAKGVDDGVERVWWLLEMLDGDEAASLFCGLWTIWSSRNKLVWEGRHFDGVFLARWCSEYQRDYASLRVNKTPKCSRPITKWVCPPLGRLKMNVDGGFDCDSGLGGIGVIVRNDKGLGIATIARVSMFVSSAFSMELEACRVGLQLGVDQGWEAIDVESDFILVVSALRSGKEDMSVEGCLVADCLELLKRF